MHSNSSLLSSLFAKSLFLSFSLKQIWRWKVLQFIRNKHGAVILAENENERQWTHLWIKSYVSKQPQKASQMCTWGASAIETTRETNCQQVQVDETNRRRPENKSRWVAIKLHNKIASHLFNLSEKLFLSFFHWRLPELRNNINLHADWDYKWIKWLLRSWDCDKRDFC